MTDTPFPDLITPWRTYKDAQWRAFPCRSNRASALGGDCERQLVYSRTHWQEAQKPDFGLRVIFEEGDKHEEAVLADLRKAGLRILEQQVALEWREYQITGHLDAVVLHEGQAVPFDVKSMSPHIWGSIFPESGVFAWAQVAEGFGKKPWLRKCAAQVQLYGLMKNVDLGILVCIDKATGLLAQVNVPLDWDYAESLIQRAVRINEHVAAGTLPDRIPFHEETCPRCDFFHICLPDMVGRDPLIFLEDETVEEILHERSLVVAQAKEYDRLDKRAKDWAKARAEKKIQIGRFLVEKKPHGPNGTRVEVTEIMMEERDGATT